MNPNEATLSQVSEPLLSSDEQKLVINYKKYLEAKNCKELTVLSESNFSLKNLSLIRSYQICEDTSKLKPLESLDLSDNKWLRPLYLDEKLKRFEEKKSIEDIISTLLEKSDIENQQKTKEKYFKEALLLAQNNSLPELEKKIKERLLKFSPRGIENPTMEQWQSVAQNAREWREFSLAVDFYKKIIAHKKTKDEDKVIAYKGLRQVFKTEQKKQAFLDITEKWAEWTYSVFKKDRKNLAHAKSYHEAQTQLARALWTEDNVSRAITILEKTSQALKNYYSLSEIYFTLGKIKEEKQLNDEAITLYKKSLDEKVLSKIIQEKTLWALAWIEYKKGLFKEASENLSNLSSTLTEPNDQSRALFWLGKSYLKLEDKKEEAIKTFENLILQDPVGYYGVMATKELNRTFLPLTPQKQQYSLTELNLIPASSRITIEALLLAGENKFAEQITSDLIQNFRAQLSPDELLILLKVYARTGMYLPLFVNLNSLPPEKKNEILSQHPDLIFPTPYQVEISEAESLSKTPSEFINAIIRQESAFNPRARSSVDAMGLTQLLPSIAKNISKKHKINYSSSDDLYEPRTSISLGAWELQDLLQRNKQNYILSICSYNASGDAIRGWLKTRYKDDPLEFIEEIPYEETRGYVKLVLRNTVFYKRLNSKTEFSFPEYLLSWKNTTSEK